MVGRKCSIVSDLEQVVEPEPVAKPEPVVESELEPNFNSKSEY